MLRLYQVYGPGQDLNRLIPITISGCLKNKSFPCSEGKQFRDFAYVVDIVDAILKSLKNKKALGEIINIGTGKTSACIIKQTCTWACRSPSSSVPSAGTGLQHPAWNWRRVQPVWWVGYGPGRLPGGGHSRQTWQVRCEPERAWNIVPRKHAPPHVQAAK